MFARALKTILSQLPADDPTLVGFATFDSTLHFYNLKVSILIYPLGVCVVSHMALSIYGRERRVRLRCW